MMVYPGGTGRPIFVIAARFVPLPPSSAFISPQPSQRLLPKKYVILPPFTEVAGREFFFTAAFAGRLIVAVAISLSPFQSRQGTSQCAGNQPAADPRNCRKMTREI